MDLRNAAERIRILHLVARIPVHAVDQFASPHHRTDMGCHDRLSGMRPDRLDERRKGNTLSFDGFKGEGCCNIRRICKHFCVMEGKDADGCHGLRPVVERDPLFRFEDNGLQSGHLQRFPSRDAFSLVERFPFPDQHGDDVRQGGEIAAGTDGPLCRDDGNDARMENIKKAARQSRSESRRSPSQANWRGGRSSRGQHLPAGGPPRRHSG